MNISGLKRLQKIAEAIIPKQIQYQIFNIGLLARSIRYQGNTYICPVCSTQLNSWLNEDEDESRSHKRFCPRCLSKPRNRLLWVLATEVVAFEPGDRILHIAPGWGLRHNFRKISEITYHTNDNERYATYDASSFDDFYFHIEEVQEGLKTYDYVYCSHVLEHIDDHAALRSIHNLLDSGGTAIFQVPVNDSAADTVEFDNVPVGKHRRQYGRDFPERVRQAGFSVQKADELYSIEPEDREQYGLPRCGSTSNAYIVTKK